MQRLLQVHPLGLVVAKRTHVLGPKLVKKSPDIFGYAVPVDLFFSRYRKPSVYESQTNLLMSDFPQLSDYGFTPFATIASLKA